jgi:hypothetical protein
VLHLWSENVVQLTIQPSFIPITGAAFCAVLAFALVLALQYSTGQIKIKFSTVDFEGASGPIILWCLCFFVIAYGLYMMGLADVAKAPASSDTRSVHQLFSTAKQPVSAGTQPSEQK